MRWLRTGNKDYFSVATGFGHGPGTYKVPMVDGVKAAAEIQSLHEDFTLFGFHKPLPTDKLISSAISVLRHGIRKKRC